MNIILLVWLCFPLLCVFLINIVILLRMNVNDCRTIILRYLPIIYFTAGLYPSLQFASRLTVNQSSHTFSSISGNMSKVCEYKSCGAFISFAARYCVAHTPISVAQAPPLSPGMCISNVCEYGCFIACMGTNEAARSS
jgi:hypothetical protein